MTLFADGKLVTVTTTAVALYNVTDLRSVPADNCAREAKIQPYWVHRDPKLYFQPHMSKPYPHLQTTRLAIAVKDGIYGLVVPLHSNDDPWYQLLSNVNLSHALWVAFSINKFFFLNASGNEFLLRRSPATL
jgi:hypothetical protein